MRAILTLTLLMMTPVIAQAQQPSKQPQQPSKQPQPVKKEGTEQKVWFGFGQLPAPSDLKVFCPLKPNPQSELPNVNLVKICGSI
jgi:hypothetical protein